MVPFFTPSNSHAMAFTMLASLSASLGVLSGECQYWL